MKLPDDLTVDFARRWIAAHGADPTPVQDGWCWRDFANAYPQLREAWFAEIERATVCGPAWAAYYAGLYLGMPRERVYAVIERARQRVPLHVEVGIGKNWGDAK